MATVKPFTAVRPNVGLESKIAALPYDVYNRKEAKEVVRDDPYSFLNIDRPETQFSDDFDMYSSKAYQTARSLYESFLSDGKFIKEKKPCFYLYEETMQGRKQLGLVCVASVAEYENGIIKKHENTRADKELDRINHVDTVNAQTGPIFLAYRDNKELSSFFKAFVDSHKPYFEFEFKDQTYHRGWIIEDENDISFICNQFDSIPNLYIADGHHRCASACKVSAKRRANLGNAQNLESDYFLSILFPDSELMIMDYNRVVKDLNGYDEDTFLSLVQKSFFVEEMTSTMEKPTHKNEIFMYMGERQFRISLKEEFLTDDPVESLDVSYLQNFLLGPILGIKDPKTDARIDFVGGIRGVGELKRRLSVDAKVAFCMYPTQMSELFRVADAGLLMPPKSTWFEPKLLSGLFIHEI